MEPLVIKLGGVLLDSEEASGVYLPHWRHTAHHMTAHLSLCMAAAVWWMS